MNSKKNHTENTEQKTLHIFSPASIGNFIVGFDTLGAAIESDMQKLGDDLIISSHKKSEIINYGRFADQIPTNKTNLIAIAEVAFNRLLAKNNIPIETLKFEVTKHLPAGSGLGSSSASIVATLFGLNQWYGMPFTQNDILKLSAEIEGGNSGGKHYDNVAPALLGGLQLITQDSNETCYTLPYCKNWYIALCFPDIQISTKEGRALLPDTIKLKQAVQMQSRLSGFIHALHNKDESALFSLMQDDIIIPARQNLIPHYQTAEKEVKKLGAKVFGISGSGPTCFAIATQKDTAHHICEQLLEIMQQGHRAFSCVAQISSLGTRITV